MACVHNRPGKTPEQWESFRREVEFPCVLSGAEDEVHHYIVTGLPADASEADYLSALDSEAQRAQRQIDTLRMLGSLIYQS